MYKHSDYSITQILLIFVNVYSYRPPSWYNDSKCVVYLSKLMELLSICPSCTGKSDVKVHRRLGAYLMYKTICTLCKKERTWSNSEEHRGIPLINLILSAGILFSGSLATKFLRALSMINVSMFGGNTYLAYQKAFLHPVSNFHRLNLIHAIVG